MSQDDKNPNRIIDDQSSLFAQIINFSPVGIFQVDTHDCFIYVNTRWQTITRYTLKDILGKSWWTLILPEDREAVFKEWRESEKLSRECLVHCRLIRKDGEIRWVEMRSRFLFHDGGKVIFGTCEDITERKIMERQLEDYSKELERSNRDLEDFASIASHDLQEPLRKIMNFGDRLASFFEEPDPDRAKDYLGRIQGATRRMQDFIENLLNYSRITTRARPLEPVALNPLIEDVLTLFDVRLSNSGGNVEVLPLPILMGDSFQLRQLFQNLIENAIKFHRPGVPPQISIFSHEDSSVSEITIEDNGVGFDEKHLEKIFKPFERLHARSEYEGTGMGLAICKKIVDRHGGQLNARSRPGEGTQFILTFPLKKTKLQPSA